MTFDLPEIVIDPNLSGERIVTVDGKEVSDIARLMDTVPTLWAPDHASRLATIANHLVRGYEYEVILDPTAFREAYLADMAAEAARGPTEFQIGQVRLGDYGAPDFTKIQAPQITGSTLIFYTRSANLRLAYRAKITADGSASYDPLEAAGTASTVSETTASEDAHS